MKRKFPPVFKILLVLAGCIAAPMYLFNYAGLFIKEQFAGSETKEKG